MVDVDKWNRKYILGGLLLFNGVIFCYVFMRISKHVSSTTTCIEYTSDGKPIIYGNYSLCGLGYKDSYDFHNCLFQLCDVCIESDGTKTNHNRIIMYNAPRDMEIKLSIDGIPHAPWASWKIEMRNESLPRDYIVKDYPAYFMTTTCSGNLHHILTDSFWGKYDNLYSNLTFNDACIHVIFLTLLRTFVVTSYRSFPTILVTSKL